MKFFGTIIVIVLLSIIVGIVWFLGSSNPYTPAGYMGYVTKGAIFGSAKFIEIQKGPVSPGRGWLLDVVNASITPYTYGEHFIKDQAILSKDNLKLQFSAHIVWKLRQDRFKEFIEKYATVYDGATSDKIVEIAYNNFLREPFRTFVRDKIQSLDGLAVKDNITDIGNEIFGKVQGLTKDTPFEIMSTVVGTIQYPPEVAVAVAKKMATTQMEEQKETEIRIEKKKASIRVEDAKGVAESMKVINQQLTAAYLQHEAIEAQKAMIGSPNHTTVYIPVGPMGVPLTGIFNVTGDKK